MSDTNGIETIKTETEIATESTEVKVMPEVVEELKTTNGHSGPITENGVSEPIVDTSGTEHSLACENGNTLNNNNENGNELNGENGNGHHNDTNGNDSQILEEATNNTSRTEVELNGKQNGNRSKNELELFRKVFVGSLNYSTTDESLRNHFSQFGELVDSVIMKESKTGKSRGFGFVTYANSAMVDEMMLHRPHKLDGRELETKRATPREESSKPGAEMTTKKLFVGGLREGMTEDMLKGYFNKYGKIEDCIVMKEKESNKTRGFGFVTFEDYDSVDKVVLEKFHIVNNQNVAVKKALPKDQTVSGGGGGRGGYQSRNNGHHNHSNNYNSHNGNGYSNGHSNGRNHRGNGYSNGHNGHNGFNSHNRNYNDYDEEFNSNNFNDDGGFNNFSANNHSNSAPSYSNNLTNPSVPGMPGVNFTNLALMAQKMLQAANMGQAPGNYGTAANTSPGFGPGSNGNGFGNLSPSAGLIGPGDRNHPGNMNNGFSRGGGGGGPMRQNGGGGNNRRPGPYNGKPKQF